MFYIVPDWLTLQVQTWSFSPLAEKTYTLKPTLTFWPIQTPGCNKSHLTLKVLGMGSKGFIEVWLSLCFCDFMCVHVSMYLNCMSILKKIRVTIALTFWSMNYPWNEPNQACLFPPQAEKAVVDVGETLVGSFRSIEVPLVNNSPCPVSFCLSVQQTRLDEEPIYDLETGILFCGFLCGLCMCMIFSIR